MTRHYGRAYYNKKRRKDMADPFLMGFATFPNGKASIAVWQSKEREGSLTLTLKAWNSKFKIYSHGHLDVVPDTEKRTSTAPDYRGEVKWGGKRYSVFCWMQQAEMFLHGNTRIEAQAEILRLKKEGRYKQLPHLNFTFEPITD